MSLMCIDRDFMWMTKEQIQFQLEFGTKTDRPNHLSNMVYLYENKDEPHLCPVF